MSSFLFPPAKYQKFIQRGLRISHLPNPDTLITIFCLKAGSLESFQLGKGKQRTHPKHRGGSGNLLLPRSSQWSNRRSHLFYDLPKDHDHDQLLQSHGLFLCSVPCGVNMGGLLAWRWLVWWLSGYIGVRLHSNNIFKEWKRKTRISKFTH